MLYRPIGVPGIFVLTGVLALAAIAVVSVVPPEPVAHFDRRARHGAQGARGRARDAELLRLNSGIFALHMVLMALFVVVPTLLVERAGLPVAEHWKVYLPVVLASFVLMLPADPRRGPLRALAAPCFLGAVALLAAVQVGLACVAHRPCGTIAVLLLVFFVAFNVLEALLPSLVSRVAPTAARGDGHRGLQYDADVRALRGWRARRLARGALRRRRRVLAGCGARGACWLAVAAGMRIPPPRTSTARSRKPGRFDDIDEAPIR